MTTQPQPDAGLREALLYVQAALNWGVFNQNPSVASSNEMRDIKEVVRLALRSTPAAPHQHRFDVVIRDDEHMRLLGCSNTPCEESYQWDR